MSVSRKPADEPATVEVEITLLRKRGGPLTKKISLGIDGQPRSDGSACVMAKGHASRLKTSLPNLGGFFERMESCEAIALGTMHADLPDRVEVVTKRKLNGTASGIIARTKDFIDYRPDKPALMLLDADTKGMPDAVKARINEAGSMMKAMMMVLPELAGCARLIRPSTSTGLYRTDNGTQFQGSPGWHTFPLIVNGSDIERCLKTLHDRCWLHGFGWMMVGAGGQLLNRSIVDKSVYAPERLVFEGPPVMVSPLAQDRARRKPRVYDGPPLDTREAVRSLTIVETAELKRLQEKEVHRLKPEAAAERTKFIDRQAASIVARTGCKPTDARRIAARQCAGILLPDVELPFDDPDLAGVTVAAVLADPARNEGETLADPLEGVEYGVGKAMVMRRDDGSPWIHSYAHGHTIYELRYDAAAIEAAFAEAPEADAADVLVQIIPRADVDATEESRLKAAAAARAKTSLQAINRRVKDAKAAHDKRLRDGEQLRLVATRTDPRPQIPAPPPDAPWIPQMTALNEVLGASRAAEPPMRDIDGVVTQVRVRRVPKMHVLTPEGANAEGGEEAQQPAAEQPLLTRLTETSLAELIERHIDYIDATGRSVHLGPAFVKHFHTRNDDALPIVAAIATLPMVLPDGTLLSKRGLDRRRGIVFRVPPHLLSVIPSPADCTPTAVAAAMRFLMNDWLCDVATDYTGRCILIAAALTIIERSLLADRPAFFVTAGRRGGGKTTALVMLMMAITGIRPSAAAWSPNEEERRKALLAYLMEAVPAIIWDNILRGTQISCRYIEQSCTTAFYSDRRLGVSELVAVSASVIHLFTGNNIAPKGDFASRSLKIELQIDRADPENRDFKHPDPVGWTEANRSEILSALYTILLGNPALRPGSNVQIPTRFKTWWRLVGSAVENAAACHKEAVDEQVKALVIDAPDKPPVTISFRDLFLAQEDDDEEGASLAEVLAALAAEWPGGEHFAAAGLARFVNNRSDYRINVEKERAAAIRDFLFPNSDPNRDISPAAISKALKKRIGEPVRWGKETLILKNEFDPHSKVLDFFVRCG